MARIAARICAMNKRIAAGVLWFLAGWYGGLYIAFFLGVSDALGPILGIAAAAMFAGDPLGVIWARRETAVEFPTPLVESTTDSYAEAA
jgi:hypothetical protein